MLNAKPISQKILTMCIALTALLVVTPKVNAHELEGGQHQSHEEKQKEKGLSVSLEKNTLCPTVKACQALANDGNPEAQEILAIYHLEGKEIPVDKPRARYWLEKAIENGTKNPNIPFILGNLYLNGEGEEQDIEKGIALSTKAAKLGSLQAQLFVWGAYFFGKDGFPQDYDKALTHLEQLKRDYPKINKDKKVDVFICMAKKKSQDALTFQACGGPSKRN